MTGAIVPASVAYLALEALREGSHHVTLAMVYLEGIGDRERAAALREALHQLATVAVELEPAAAVKP